MLAQLLSHMLRRRTRRDGSHLISVALSRLTDARARVGLPEWPHAAQLSYRFGNWLTATNALLDLLAEHPDDAVLLCLFGLTVMDPIAY